MQTLSTLTLASQAGPVQRIFFRQDALSDFGADSDYLFLWIFWFSVGWFILLMGLMGYWVIKYRRRPGVPAARSPSHNTKLEIAWTVLPSLALVYMFFAGFHSYIDTLVAPAESEQIEVTGSKWVWNARYPNGTESPETTTLAAQEVPVFYAPAGRPVRFRMESRDVIHAFWIPDFRIKIDVMPNRYTSYWLESEEIDPDDPTVKIDEKKGFPYREHWIFCAEYCGDQHSEMAAVLRVVPEYAYQEKLREFADRGDLSPPERGLRIARMRGCFQCHSMDGKANVGPTWLNAYGYEVQLADGSSIPEGDRDEWDNYVRESILVPGAKIHAGYPNQMNSFQGLLNDDQIKNIIALLRSLSDHPSAQDPDPVPGDEAAGDEAAGEGADEADSPMPAPEGGEAG